MALLTKRKVRCPESGIFREVTQADIPIEYPVDGGTINNPGHISLLETNITEFSRQIYSCVDCVENMETIGEIEDHLEENPTHNIIQIRKNIEGSGKPSAIGINRTDGTFKKITINDEDTIIIA